MEIAVIGNSEFILGFRLAGIKKTYAAENDEKLRETHRNRDRWRGRGVVYER
jgi:vacuolar-type H+-ATPase subunit F/Vma7